MYKIFGAILIITACSGFGFSKAMELRKRVVMLEELKKMFVHLRGEISYAKNPFMEAFNNMTDKEYGKLGDFCVYMARQLDVPDGRTFYEKWCMGIDGNLRGAGFLDEDINDLKKAGERLGYLDYNMQLATIDMEVEQLEMKIARLSEEILPKQKVYRCVGVFCGLMLTILFL